MKPKAFIFDVFGTLVDWRGSITKSLAQVLAAKGLSGDAGALAVAWRNEYDPAMAPIRNGAREYTNLDVLHLENLEKVLSQAGFLASFSAQDLRQLARRWEALDPWPDVAEGLEKMRRIGLVAPCSNGSIALMSHLARHANFHWDCILGAEIAQTYKPDPLTYHAACRALQLRPDQVMMVAAHNSDLRAARDAGLQTGFFPRATEHADPAKAELVASEKWDAVGTDLPDLARKIAAWADGD